MPAKEVKTRIPLPVPPVLLVVAFMLLADLNSPGGGISRVAPQNLVSLHQSIG